MCSLVLLLTWLFPLDNLTDDNIPSTVTKWIYVTLVLWRPAHTMGHVPGTSSSVCTALDASAEKVRKPAHARGHVAGTCSGDFLQRQFSSCDIPVFAKSSVAGTELWLMGWPMARFYWFSLFCSSVHDATLKIGVRLSTFHNAQIQSSSISCNMLRGQYSVPATALFRKNLDVARGKLSLQHGYAIMWEYSFQHFMRQNISL